jgi:hypothetical protein
LDLRFALEIKKSKFGKQGDQAREEQSKENSELTAKEAK